MTERRIEHLYSCSESVFWDEIFLDPDYNRRAYLDVLKFERWEVIEEREQGDQVHRTIEATPPAPDLPAALERLISEGLGYTEHGVFDRKARRYRLQVTPKSLGSRLSISGELFTEPTGPEQCRRVYVGTVKAKAFGVAGMIEKLILDDLAKSYEKVARFTNQFIEERKQGG